MTLPFASSTPPVSQYTPAKEIIAWRAPARLAFRFNECSNPKVRASAEDYRVEPAPQGCRLTWTVAQDPGDAPWLTRQFARVVMNRTYRQSLADLRRYTVRRRGQVI